jgi:predicted unusual protein kinase regulating ubiquinone biosynthesis (AarF/ABC1/UbiB family)
MAEERKRDRLKGLTAGWASRTLATGRIAAGLGAQVVGSVLGRSGDAEVGADLGDRMDELKGLMLKMGQMASYLEGALPPETQTALRRLQRNARPLDPAVIDAVLTQELGPRPFDSFDPEPIAAASIGQVHRAVYQGQPVAVKVQYPGVEASFEVDLRNLDRASVLATLGSSIDRHDVIGELRDRLRDETDYLQEAANLARFGALWAGHPRVLLPQVIPERCTRRVLTTTFIEGMGFYDFLERSSQEERDRAGETILEFGWGSVFRHAAFNADPHPGNYLFLPDGRVAFLDFGCVRWFEADFVERWKDLVRVVVDRRHADLPQVMRATGLVAREPWDWEAHVRVLEYVYKPFLQPGFRFDHAYVRESWEAMLVRNVNLRRMAMPREWLMINRLQWGLNSVLANLESTADWVGLMRDLLASPVVAGGRPPPLASA